MAIKYIRFHGWFSIFFVFILEICTAHNREPMIESDMDIGPPNRSVLIYVLACVVHEISAWTTLFLAGSKSTFWFFFHGKSSWLCHYSIWWFCEGMISLSFWLNDGWGESTYLKFWTFDRQWWRGNLVIYSPHRWNALVYVGIFFPFTTDHWFDSPTYRRVWCFQAKVVELHMVTIFPNAHFIKHSTCKFLYEIIQTSMS